MIALSDLEEYVGDAHEGAGSLARSRQESRGAMKKTGRNAKDVDRTKLKEAKGGGVGTSPGPEQGVGTSPGPNEGVGTSP